MERRIYYFIFENEFMDDLISNLCEIFNISNKKNSNILSDDTEQVYILDAKREGISCILANKNTYVYAVYIFTNEKYADYEAEIFNQPPYVLAMFPSGDGEKTYPTVKLDNKNIVLSALKDYDGGTLLRLYNSANSKQVCSLKAGEENRGISFNPFEVKTFVKTEDELKETDMLGRRYD